MYFYILQEVSRGRSILLKNRRRSESFNLRSSQFKICFMEQQQEITYQYELFNQIGEDVIRPFVPSETVRGAQGDKGVAIKRSRRTGTSLNRRFTRG